MKQKVKLPTEQRDTRSVEIGRGVRLDPALFNVFAKEALQALAGVGI